MKAKLFTDGGSRGNPGPAAYGFVIEAEDGHVLAAQGEAIGRPSTLHARAYGSREKLERVEVGGSAVVVAHGEFRLRVLPGAEP